MINPIHFIHCLRVPAEIIATDSGETDVADGAVLLVSVVPIRQFVLQLAVSMPCCLLRKPGPINKSDGFCRSSAQDLKFFLFLISW